MIGLFAAKILREYFFLNKNLFLWIRFTDLMLVGAPPPLSLGKKGGGGEA